MESKWNLDLEKSFLNIYSFLVGFLSFFLFFLSPSAPVIGNEHSVFASQKVVAETVTPKETSTHVGMTKACKRESASLRPGEISSIMDY